MKDKKIVQIVRSPAGGIRKHIATLIDGIKDVAEVILITDESRADTAYFEFKKNSNIKVYNLKINDKPGLLDLYNCFKIYKILYSESVDIVHGHGAKGGIYSRICGFLNKSKVFYTAHGGSMHLMHGYFKNLFYSFVEKLLFTITDKVIFESRYSMDTFSKRVCDDPEKLFLNYNGVLPAKEVKDNKNLLKKDMIQLASFGLLRKIKGHHFVIDATKVLKEEYGLKVTYDIYGEGEERSNLLSQASKLGISSRVKIHNYTSDINAKMLQADVVVHPSEFESFGYVPVESMILGVPTLGSLNGGLYEVFDSGRIGFTIKELSASLIVEKILYIVNHYEAVEVKCQEAKKFVEVNFSEENFVSNYLKIILL